MIWRNKSPSFLTRFVSAFWLEGINEYIEWLFLAEVFSLVHETTYFLFKPFLYDIFNIFLAFIVGYCHVNFHFCCNVSCLKPYKLITVNQIKHRLSFKLMYKLSYIFIISFDARW